MRGLAAAIVLDEHDEALQEERAPTWHARDVVLERCRRAGVPAVLVSPVPTLTAVVTAAGKHGVVHPEAGRERAGWPAVTVVDRTDEDPWKRSLVTSALIERLRDPAARVVCVSNITGRARVLACRNCRSLVRCETCDAAVGLADDGRLECRRCGTQRPPVCQACGRSAFANLRPGVTRLREELQAAANRPVGTDHGIDVDRRECPPGTDPGGHSRRDRGGAAPGAVGRRGGVPRVRLRDVGAALPLGRARDGVDRARRADRAGGDDPDVHAGPRGDPSGARAGNPSIVSDVDRRRRELLSLPPFGALARVSGDGTDEFASALATAGLEVGRTGESALVRGPDWMELGATLNGTERPPGSRLRIEVDPPRA